MMPVYRCTNSSPHQRSQMPFPQYYFPGVEVAPPQMVMDPSQSQVWPHGSNYGYSAPCHGCCSHGSFPDYHGFRPPYGYFVPAPPFHHQYGSYPSFCEAYPIYKAPPPDYSMELPRYEYDKDTARSCHCCGCPNHPHHQKNDRGVKIEEKEPDIRKSEGDAVVPAQFRNYPYPILRIPHDNKPLEPEGADWYKRNDDRRAKQVAKSPEVSKGWFPLNMNGHKSEVQGEDGRKLQDEQNEDGRRQFPFPVIWIPYEQQQADENQTNRKLVPSSKSSEVTSADSKFVPVKPPVNHVRTEEPGANVGNQTKNDVGIMRQEKDRECTRVKQADMQKMDNSEEIERKGRGVPVKQVEDGTKDKTSSTGSKRQSLSPPKSKLPPVCLRVDPLPKKSNGNGSSRSPSPPSRKGKSAETLKESSKPSAEKCLKESSIKEQQREYSSPSKTNEVQSKMKQIKDIPVIEKLLEDSNVELSPSKPVDFQEEVSRKPGEKSENLGAECEKELARQEETARPEEELVKKEANDSAKSSSCEFEAKKKQLSETEAALLIQSAYRGYEVRKWEPLKKLKQITKVREQVAEVRNKIQALQSSSDPQIDDKQKLVIGEKIMGLLLKLDTIQGLHPSLRDIRKSLARELVALQENLDSLTSKQTIKESANSKLADLPNADSQINFSMPEMQANGTSGVDESRTEFAHVSGENAKQPGEELPSHVAAYVEFSREETAEESKAKQDTVINEALVTDPVGCQVANSQSSIEVGGETRNDNAPAKVEILDVPPLLQQPIECPLVLEKPPSSDHLMEGEEEKTQEPGVNEVPAPDTTEEPDGDKLSLLQREMPTDSELPKQIGDDDKETEHCEVEFNTEILSSALAEEDQASIIGGELPVGLIEDDQAIPQPGDPELIKEDVTKSTERENNMSNDVAPPINEVSVVNGAKQLEEAEWVKVQTEQAREEDAATSDEFTMVHKPNQVPSGEQNTCKTPETESDFREIPIDKGMLSEEKKENNVQCQEQITTEGKAPEQETSNTEDLILSKDQDTKLLEENKQLREMMKKLVEAGNEQLTVISNLTGRVKDLERKLSTNRKTRKPGYKKPKCTPSRKKPANHV